MIRTLGRSAMSVVFELGEISLFGWGALRGFFAQRSRLVKLTLGIHEIGVRCFPIIATLGALSRPRHHCEANQPAPRLGRGPGTRVRRRTRRPGAALPGPPSSCLHACDQREGRRGQREPPVPQAARLHTQRCPQPRAAGTPPATRRALGGGCAVVPAARRRWGSLVHPRGWSEGNLPQGSRWF